MRRLSLNILNKDMTYVNYNNYNKALFKSKKTTQGAKNKEWKNTCKQIENSNLAKASNIIHKFKVNVNRNNNLNLFYQVDLSDKIIDYFHPPYIPLYQEIKLPTINKKNTF